MQARKVLVSQTKLLKKQTLPSLRTAISWVLVLRRRLSAIGDSSTLLGMTSYIYCHVERSEVKSKHPLVVPIKLPGDFIGCRHARTAYVSISRSLHGVARTRQVPCIGTLRQSERRVQMHSDKRFCKTAIFVQRQFGANSHARL